MGEKVVEFDSRRVKERPSARREAWLATTSRAEAQHATLDPVVGAAVGGTPTQLLRVQIVELAKEAAALRWDREHSTDSRERQRLASRRIRALSAVALAVVELNKLEGGEPSPRVVGSVLEDLQALVEAAVVELFDAGTAQRMLTTLRARLGPVLAEIATSGGA